MEYIQEENKYKFVVSYGLFHIFLCIIYIYMCVFTVSVNEFVYIIQNCALIPIHFQKKNFS